METFSTRRYTEQAGITAEFVQDNLSRSHRGVLRGLHFQVRHPQGKLVQVLQGAVQDVVVDLRAGSPTWGQHASTLLSADNRRQLWVPPGFAHGFCVLSDEALVHYKCTRYYDPDDQAGLAWNCPRLAIAWKVSQPILSTRDRQLPGWDQWQAATAGPNQARPAP